MNDKLTVAVVFGGQSSEHSVSCVSGVTVMKALNPEKYDIVLIGKLQVVIPCRNRYL